MEEILTLQSYDPEVFETREVLNLLAYRFGLSQTKTFRHLLYAYDMKYPTIRSYFLPGALPEEIILKAAEAGNLNAFYEGLKLYPRYREPKFLVRCLWSAARGGDEVMIDLIKDLGGSSKKFELIGAAEGGHLEKLKRLVGDYPDPYVIGPALAVAVGNGKLEVVKYLFDLIKPNLEELNRLLRMASQAEYDDLVDYLISRGANDYTGIVLDAINQNRRDTVNKYLEMPGVNYGRVLELVLGYHDLKRAKEIMRGRTVGLTVLNKIMGQVNKFSRPDEIDYLIALGSNNYKGLMSSLISQDSLSLFKAYQTKVSYPEAFRIALDHASVSILNYLVTENLVPVASLNQYLETVRLDSPKVIPLLFSLGATDYTLIVVRSLKSGDLRLVKKYFDQANLDLDEAFQLASPKLYKYLVSRGPISQATLNQALDSVRNNQPQVAKYLVSLGAK
jgi:hypothetical protein